MCGVFGLRAPGRDVARLTYFGLHALQHRGQESAGIAVSEDGRLTTLRDLGLVTQVFDESLMPSAATSARSSEALTRLPLCPSATVLARPCWTSGCAFAHALEPVVE